jgi:hypothetical protein
LISGHTVFRRAKDLIDLSALIQCVEVSLGDIFDIIRDKLRTAGTFSEFINKKNDLEHAFNKLKGISNKPSFNEIYDLLTNFIKPLYYAIR